ncbi:MAG: sulfatase-like hydrolase/transferase [Desulfarculus sp.]|nr:sulfatase-like hydrolase/transferase [Desulfarculus sp.]
MNDVVYIVLDSCRYDTWEAAATPNLDRLGVVERRWAYASWTSPAHQVLLMGLLPHVSPPGVHASEVYRQELLSWRERLGAPDLEFAGFLPQLNLPTALKRLGYRTLGRVSLPVLNQHTVFATGFDDYRLMASHADFAGMIQQMSFDPGRPSFWFLNLGETHYPYLLPPEDAPRLHGLHGVVKDLAHAAEPVAVGPGFDPAEMACLRKAQVRALETVDGLLPALYAKLPADAWIIVTADHGELFGEDGYFGHGPVMHPKVFEVPFVEGRRPA